MRVVCKMDPREEECEGVAPRKKKKKNASPPTTPRLVASSRPPFSKIDGIIDRSMDRMRLGRGGGRMDGGKQGQEKQKMYHTYRKAHPRPRPHRRSRPPPLHSSPRKNSRNSRSPPSIVRCTSPRHCRRCYRVRHRHRPTRSSRSRYRSCP